MEKEVSRAPPDSVLYRSARRDRLERIFKTIEGQAFFHGSLAEQASDINALKQAFRLQGLWVIQGDDIHKSGAVDYTRELENFNSLKAQYADLRMMKMKRSRDHYYMIDVSNMTILFSTFVELTTNDMYLLVREIAYILRIDDKSSQKTNPDSRLKKKKAFLETTNKHKD